MKEGREMIKSKSWQGTIDNWWTFERLAREYFNLLFSGYHRDHAIRGIFRECHQGAINLKVTCQAELFGNGQDPLIITGLRLRLLARFKFDLRARTTKAVKAVELRTKDGWLPADVILRRYHQENIHADL